MEKYYRHFKGGLYQLIGTAKDSETLEEMVVYQALYGERQLWVRPAAMFFGKVERDGKEMDELDPILSRYEPIPKPSPHDPEGRYDKDFIDSLYWDSKRP